MKDDFLPSILDRLLPGSPEGWPAAGTHGLGPEVATFMGRTPEGTAALDIVLATVDAGFHDLTAEQQTADLERVEKAVPEAFERLVVASYNMYYTDPEVRRVIERLTGYEARPPQPLGYDLEPFDEALLERQRQRPEFWRKTGEEA